METIPTEPKIHHKPPQLTTNPEDSFVHSQVARPQPLTLALSQKTGRRIRRRLNRRKDCDV
jgi:hypothetical protein